MKSLITIFLRKVYMLFAPKVISGEEASDKITSMLNSEKPCLITRIGSCELQFLAYQKYFPLFFLLKRRSMYNIKNNAGFFSVNTHDNKTFYDLYIRSFGKIDGLISWRAEELLFKKALESASKISKRDFDLFFLSKIPWTSALENKRVLVIHPFAETILRQYTEKREFLFENKRTLPVFKSLEVVKSVLSLAGNEVPFKTWFDALTYMQSEMDKCEYDVAIIGCGAYGFPLAAYAKKQGKKAIHMGGVTQFLFGIKGKRYVDDPVYAKHINEYFVYPPKQDRPPLAEKVEGGCYW